MYLFAKSGLTEFSFSSNVAACAHMFDGCKNLKHVSRINDMSKANMFANCPNLEVIELNASANKLNQSVFGSTKDGGKNKTYPALMVVYGSSVPEF